MNRDQLSPEAPIGEPKANHYDPDNGPSSTQSHIEPDQTKNKLSRYLIRVEKYLNIIFRSMMLLSCLSLACLVFAQVIMRYVLESPFSGIEEMSILLAVWVYFLGMGYATREREHIRGGIVSLIVKDEKKVAYIRFSGSIICMAAACVFGYFAYQYALREITLGRVSINMRWPRGIWSSSMIVGFAMMVGYFLVEAIREYRNLLNTAKNQDQNSNHNQNIKPRRLES